ncbi:25481_t:CDS:2 [Gigaspora margarita]|uniref:25481_t:CDS:1 n=1 Tax=Gigaspora margarita TaxID=4874 RepID=A0ABN7V1F4_GIGMA|nr:25481_t:CDS:2 [Gigaspora margarita]
MNPFRILLYSLIVISLALTNVTCISPDPRYNTSSPPWNQIVTSPIPIPLFSAVPCLSNDKSKVYLVGGMSQDKQNPTNLTIPQTSAYAFNINNLEWTAPVIEILITHF